MVCLLGVCVRSMRVLFPVEIDHASNLQARHATSGIQRSDTERPYSDHKVLNLPITNEITGYFDGGSRCLVVFYLDATKTHSPKKGQ